MQGIGRPLGKGNWIVPVLFFTVLLLVGLGIFKDYGISWDEKVQRKYGQEVYNYILKGDRELFTDRHRYYGPVFELLLYSAEKTLDLNDTRDIYLMRHLITFIMFWTGTFFFYLLCKREFESWKVGLLGSIFLILSPRIFAHGFYNSKDIPFMAMFTISVFTLLRYLEAKTMLRAATHAVACALLVDIRIVGTLMPILTVAFIAHEVVRLREAKGELKRIARSFGLYLLILVYLTVLLWPTLWRDPIHNFLRVLEGMRNFPWEATVLYRGANVWSTDLPWHYTPVWIAISTPVTLIVLFLLGLGISIWSWFRGSAPSAVSKRDSLLVMSWFFLPLICTILSKAVLYDAWRHTFFVYPAFLVLSLIGLISLLRIMRTRLQGMVYQISTGGIILIVALNLGLTALFMVRNHPHQNVYFNSLIGGAKGAQGNFELDYWGLSYRKALEHILSNDRDERVRLYVATAPGRYNADIIEAEDRKRLVFVSQPHKAEYYLTNFRWEPETRQPGQEFYSVEVDGVKIMAVYKLRDM